MTILGPELAVLVRQIKSAQLVFLSALSKTFTNLLTFVPRMIVSTVYKAESASKNWLKRMRHFTACLARTWQDGDRHDCCVLMDSMIFVDAVLYINPSYGEDVSP